MIIIIGSYIQILEQTAERGIELQDEASTYVHGPSLNFCAEELQTSSSDPTTHPAQQVPQKPCDSVADPRKDHLLLQTRAQPSNPGIAHGQYPSEACETCRSY